MIALPPINYTSWIDDNRHLLKPPIGNQVAYKDTEFIIMVVGGPNVRTDFHINEGEEFFYQLEGDMVLRVLDNSEIKDVPIEEGEIFLLPPNVPHSPQRFENTVGLVVERKRTEGELDGLAWFCEKCSHTLYEERFQLGDITKDLPPVFDRYYSEAGNRKCEKCGWEMPDRN